MHLAADRVNKDQVRKVGAKSSQPPDRSTRRAKCLMEKTLEPSLRET